MTRHNASEYDITTTTPHEQATSANTGDVQSISRPEEAIACYLTATTTAARVVFDGSTPGATNGIVVPTGQLFLFSVGTHDVKFASSAGTASVVDVLWLR